MGSHLFGQESFLAVQVAENECGCWAHGRGIQPHPSWKRDSGGTDGKVQQGAPQGWDIGLGKHYLEAFTGRKGQKGGSGWTAGGISSWKGWIWKELEDFAAVPSAFALPLHPVLPHGQLGSARTRHWEGGCCPDPAWESLSPSSSSELVPIKWNHLCPIGRTVFTAVPQSYWTTIEINEIQ